MDVKLQDLVDTLRDKEMSPDEYQDQRVSFAYGNSSSEDSSTKDEVREAVLGSSKLKS